MGSSSLCENEFFQLPAQVATADFDLSHLDIPSDDIFSVEPLCALDPCAVGAVESSENRFQPELPPLGGHGQPQESLALDKLSNSLVFEESTSHASFNEEDYYCRPDPPPVSFDLQDLGAALKGDGIKAQAICHRMDILHQEDGCSEEEETQEMMIFICLWLIS